MIIREPVVAGRFYPSSEESCRQEVDDLIAAARLEPARNWKGGIVPHAGWVFSGDVAAEVFTNLRQAPPPDVIVLFGGTHRYRGSVAAMFGSGRWQTPVGPVSINDRLAERVLGQTNLIVEDPYAHESEHSLEVQIPILIRCFPNCSILPIMVPSVDTAAEIGLAVGRTLTSYDYNAMVVGSTDLTHYGPSYDFTPRGTDENAYKWAMLENDADFIDLVETLEADKIVDEANRKRNACSSGAVAATLAAVKSLGATDATVLAHKHSRDVTTQQGGGLPKDSVGYAGIVFS